jgi:hypothetical protein
MISKSGKNFPIVAVCIMIIFVAWLARAFGEPSAAPPGNPVVKKAPAQPTSPTEAVSPKNESSVEQRKSSHENKGYYEPDNLDRFHVGFGASTFSGVGLSFQYMLHPVYRLKTNFLIIYLVDGKDKDMQLFSGLEIQRDIHSFRSMRLYFLFGGSIYYSKSNNQEGEGRAFIGPGIGIEIYLSEQLAFNASLGWQYWDELGKGNFYGFYPGGGIGFTYGLK